MSGDVKQLIQKAAENSNEIIPALVECIELAKAEFEANEEDASNLMKIVEDKSLSCEVTACTLQLIANITKVESNRPLFNNEGFMSALIKHLMSESDDLCLQSVRSLANICAENADAANLYMECGGVENIMCKADLILESDEKSWTQIIPNACACVRNMVIDNEKLNEKFLANNALGILWKCFCKFHTKDIKIATFAISGIEAMADSTNGLQQLESSKILSEMCSIMRKCNDDLLEVLLKELLLDYGKKEETSIMLCKNGFVEVFCELIEKRPDFNKIECTDEMMKEMADVVVLLTSSEGFTVLQQKERHFLSGISSWIQSPNTHIQVSAGLILGNYARSEETCKEIVSNKIHENLINVMKEHLDDEDYYDRFQSYGSCLRNLTIPVESKSVLIEAGLHLLAVELIKKPSLGVQFKGLGIIRLLTQGNAQITAALLLDDDLISKVCELSEVSCVSSVPSEAQRLMASLFKHNNSEEPIRNAISLGGLKPVLALLSSDHLIMQNEGLIGLIIAITSVSNCLPNLIENEALQKVLKLMGKDDVQTQTIFNCITVIQAISSIDGGIDVLTSHQVAETLENFRNHNEEIIRNKIVETLGFINRT